MRYSGTKKKEIVALFKLEGLRNSEGILTPRTPPPPSYMGLPHWYTPTRLSVDGIKGGTGVTVLLVLVFLSGMADKARTSGYGPLPLQLTETLPFLVAIS